MFKEPVDDYLKESGMCTKAEAKKQAMLAIMEYIQENNTNELKSFVTRIIDSHSSKATAQTKHSQATTFGTGNNPDMRRFREETGSGYDQDYDQDDDPDDDPRDVMFSAARDQVMEDKRYKTSLAKPLKGLTESVSVTLPEEGFPTGQSLRSFYEETYPVITSNGFLLNKWNKMLESRSCLPKRHGIGKKELESFQRHLYMRVRHQVPPENKDLKNVLDTHAETIDGFAVLRSIVYHGSDMLDEYTSNFGPKWDKNKDPLLYAVVFQSQLQENERKHKIHYLPVEISLEFLNKAIKNDYKRTLATTMQETIISWDEENRDKGKPFPDRFSLPTLASKLAKSKEPSTSGENPSPNVINAVVAQVNAISSSTRTNSQRNKIRGRYSKTNLEKNHKKQCQCCKRFVHDISDKTVCYFGA